MVLQSEERQVGHVNVNLDIDISVVSERKWLKFGVQAHFFQDLWARQKTMVADQTLLAHARAEKCMQPIGTVSG